MKKFFTALTVALALSGASASAADLPSIKGPPAPPPPPPPLWTGFYLGLNIGGGWTNRHDESNAWPLLLASQNPVNPWGNGWGNNWTPVVNPVTNTIVFVPTGNGSNSSGGVVGGGQVGYNYQFSPLFVVGLEADIQGTSIGSHGGGNWWGGNFGPSIPWFGTVRGRAGFLVTPTLLAYGTGGFAYGEVRHTFNSWWNNNNNDIHTGWTAGAGLEWLFLPNWSAKIEYLFVDLERNNNGGWFDWGSRRREEINVVRVGVNWHWNLFAPAPVVARY